MKAKKVPAKITRNQKMALQPRNWAKMPPRTGPSAGPSRVPESTKPMYLPRSAGVAISDTTALVMAMVGELPVD